VRVGVKAKFITMGGVGIAEIKAGFPQQEKIKNGAARAYDRIDRGPHARTRKGKRRRRRSTSIEIDLLSKSRPIALNNNDDLGPKSSRIVCHISFQIVTLSPSHKTTIDRKT
jgi:hypothetical protein